MEILVNGRPADVSVSADTTLGEVLGLLDERLEAAGHIIIALDLDGKPVDPDTIPSIASLASNTPGRLELRSESSAVLRENALDTLMQLLDAATEACQTGGSALEALQETWQSYVSAFSGLYSAEEESFLDAFKTELATGGHKAMETAHKLKSFFADRLSELKDPRGAMNSAAQVFKAIKSDIAEVPIRMQTGKDADAMRTMMVTVELINKVVRLLPELARTEPAGSEISIDGKTISEFFSSFNEILKELAGAFESKDGVLIGDLAEYEILPRLEALFASTEEQLGGAP